MAENNPDLKLAYEALSGKQQPFTKLINYYDGNQPLMYSHERLKEVFDKSSVNFIQNWCAVVIDAALDRLVFKGWDISNQKKTDSYIDAFYQKNAIQKMAADLHRDALITEEAYIIFDNLDNEIRAFRNDPRLVAVFYESDNPDQLRLAAKWWKDKKEKKTRLNLYYSDHIEKYIGKENLNNEKSFTLEAEVENPFSEIPVIQFHSGNVELPNIIPIQDAINKTFSDMMVVGEFNAFQQRWMVTNADISSVKNNPKTIFQIPKGASDEESTQVGSFPAADLNKFLETMDKLANSIAIISRTPKHYFHDTGGNISGDALVVMESPLVKKVTIIQENLSLGWKNAADFVLRQSGKKIEKTEITTVWDSPETSQPVAEAQEIQALVNTGIPLETILRRKGWGTDEIEQMRKDMEEEKKRNATMAKQALEIARLTMEQDNEV